MHAPNKMASMIAGDRVGQTGPPVIATADGFRASRADYVTTTRQRRRHAASAKFQQRIIKLYKTAVIVNRTNSKVYEPFVALFHLHDTSMS